MIWFRNACDWLDNMPNSEFILLLYILTTVVIFLSLKVDNANNLED